MEVAIRRYKNMVSGNQTNAFQPTLSKSSYVPVSHTSNFPSVRTANYQNQNSLAVCGDANRNKRNVKTAIIHLQPHNRKKLPMDVLIVSTIASPLHNASHPLVLINCSASVDSAHIFSNIDNFKSSVLIVLITKIT